MLAYIFVDRREDRAIDNGSFLSVCSYCIILTFDSIVRT